MSAFTRYLTFAIMFTFIPWSSKFTNSNLCFFDVNSQSRLSWIPWLRLIVVAIYDHGSGVRKRVSRYDKSNGCNTRMLGPACHELSNRRLSLIFWIVNFERRWRPRNDQSVVYLGDWEKKKGEEKERVRESESYTSEADEWHRKYR